MFAVIQKVKNKKPDRYGASKELIVKSYSFSLPGKSGTKYYYDHSDERFERPILDAYKIMIHHSYRQDGKVKKKQWVICTIGYYYLFESWVGDFIRRDHLDKKLSEMGITEAELWDMVYEKLDPIIDQVKAEFESTEEYRVHSNHQQIIKKYNEDKKKFEQLYGSDTYDYCYDLFGVLRNEGYFKELKDKLKREAEYRKSSYSNQYSGNYGSDGSNFNDYYSSYFKTSHSNYTDEEKLLLKKIFRSLSKTFHPDITKDDGEIMKLINKLKEGWGI